MQFQTKSRGRNDFTKIARDLMCIPSKNMYSLGDILFAIFSKLEILTG